VFKHKTAEIITRNTPIGVVLRESSAEIHLAMSMCVHFLVQGLTPQKAVKGTIVVPLNSPPLVCNNAVEFVFLSQGVWQLWAYPFSRSRWG
jgi:hypothetical protein